VSACNRRGMRPFSGTVRVVSASPRPHPGDASVAHGKFKPTSRAKAGAAMRRIDDARNCIDTDVGTGRWLHNTKEDQQCV
jgi:hypothetical protein